MSLYLSIKKNLFFKFITYLEEFEYKILLNFYSKIYLSNKNSINNTFFESEKKIGLVVVSDSTIISIRKFIKYHFSIGINEIYISTSKKITGFNNLFLISRKFKDYDQKKITNQLIHLAFKNKCEYVFILDDDEFLFSNKRINLDRVHKNFIFSVQINFLSKRVYKKNDYTFRFKNYYSEKRLIFNKDMNINKYISKKLILVKKNSSFKFITKGNHNYNNRIYQNLASNSIFLLHLKLINNNDIKKRVLFEKNRNLVRKNRYESITSSYFYNLSKDDLKIIWNLNSIDLADKRKTFIRDYSAKSCT